MYPEPQSGQRVIRSAIISACKTYRYRLERRFGDGPTLMFVMVNPSTADAEQDDPTIRKCIGFAERASYGRIIVGNKFAFRATDVRELRGAADTEAAAWRLPRLRVLRRLRPHGRTRQIRRPWRLPQSPDP